MDSREGVIKNVVAPDFAAIGIIINTVAIPVVIDYAFFNDDVPG